MQELSRLPPEIQRALGGEAFRRRRRIVLPFLTADPGGFPRAALLAAGEVRATSPTALAIAVRAGSRTALNLIRRRQATLLYLQRNVAASIRVRAGRGRTSRHDPDRTIFPLSVYRVRFDHAAPVEGNVALLAGPSFSGTGARALFSEELYAELGGLDGA
jgi:hypothetical protein